MSFVSIGDLSGSLRLQYLNAALRAKGNRLGQEMTTGRAADLTKKSGGALDLIGSLTRSLKMLDTYKIAVTEQASLGHGLQNALQSLQNGVGDLGARLSAGTLGATAISTKSEANSALAGFTTAISALNTTIAGRSLFAGNAFDRPAVVSAAKILDDLRAATAGAKTAGQVEMVVASYFDNPQGGYMSAAYLGSQKTAGPTSVSDTASIEFSVTAARPEIRNILKGLATAALVTRSVFQSDEKLQADVLKSAGKTILASTEGVIQLRATIGGQQARLDKIQSANAARKTGLRLEVNALTSVDPYETATQLQQVQTNLEALYLATSKLSQLTLTRFLR